MPDTEPEESESSSEFEIDKDYVEMEDLANDSEISFSSRESDDDSNEDSELSSSEYDSDFKPEVERNYMQRMLE